MDEETITRLRINWAYMWDRCTNTKSKQYADYGGRGIYVSQEWEGFLAFRDWALLNGYTQGLQLDRVDNDGPYAPDNCRYATPKENSLNRRSTRWIEAFGERKSISQWSEDPRCVVAYATLRRRLNSEWLPEEAIALIDRKERTRKCAQGHLMSADNVYVRASGSKICKKCAKKRAKDNYKKR